ncbi:MAG: alpha-L-rhamnosidase, partial [Chthonomonadales bacterium]|nr:alpha-L-rhamnosidase [Chthonomonadales bacterium]
MLYSQAECKKPPRIVRCGTLCIIDFEVEKVNMTRYCPLICTFLVLALLGIGAHSARAQGRGDLLVSGLRCEGQVTPLGIEALHPKLGWRLEARTPALRGLRQTAYRILAATTPERLTEKDADLWDSGNVKSDASAWIPYGGHPLTPATRCWWKVQVWDQKGYASAWSRATRWDTGLTQEAQWGAQWIGAPANLTQEGAPCFRKAFTLKPGWRTVRAFVCGLGYHEFTVNGKKADSRVLEPAQTEYPKRVLYSAYDVTHLVQAGGNVLGVMLGNGWYNQDRVWGGMSYGPPVLRLRFEAEYPDGTRQAVVSDTTWQVVAGPVTSNNIYAGETYDARRTLDWNGARIAGKLWSPAMPVQGPTGALICPSLPPIRAVKTLTPVPPREVAPSVLLYDMR